MAYILLFTGTLLLSVLFRYKSVDQGKAKTRLSYYVITTMVLALFIGLRGIDVGSDTQTYFYHFTNLKVTSFSSIFSRYESDGGFYYLTAVLARVLKNYNLYLFVTSLIYLCPIATLIYKKSSNSIYSYFLFYSFGLFTFAMSTLKQSIAIGLCVTAYLLIRKNKLASLIFIILAGSIHYSAFVFLPVLLFDKIKLKQFTRFLMIIVPFVIAFSLGNIINVILSFADKGNYDTSIYGTRTVGGIGMILFLTFILAIGLYMQYRQNVFEDGEVKNLFILVYFALLIFISTRFNLAVMRLYYYYLIFLIVYIPNIITKINDKSLRLIMNAIIIFASLYFLIFKVFSDPTSVASKLMPYYFFWE